MVDSPCCAGYQFVLYKQQHMEKEQSKLESTIRLVRSQQFTPEMAINYLYHWRQKENLLSILLERINQFFKAGNYHLVPTAIFIMSLQPNEQLQRFCENLSKESLSCYLLLRWSYSTYLLDRDAARNRLDNCIFSKNSQEASNLQIEELDKLMRQKQKKLNYTICLNDYYDRLFHIPEKLKKIGKEERNNNLRQRLEKLHTKFYDRNPEQRGILLPVQHKSSMAVRVSYPHCVTFSTKERVPFKIVYETISQDDLIACSLGIIDEKLKEAQSKQAQEEEKQSLVLPQSYFGTNWNLQIQNISSNSPYKHCSSYRIRSFMIKSGDDLRQEHMAMQLISMVKQICKKQNIKIWLRTYAVIPFDQESGLIQFVENTRTVSFLKQKSRCSSLRDVYKQLFGSNWETSISNFVESLAGYSVVQYLFQIKDRHNNNILIDDYGHIIHIDFSFIISSSPGNFGFEKAPFKLTKDYLQLMEGTESDIFLHFKHLFFFALKFIRNYKRQILERVEMMNKCKNMKCFLKFDREALARRFHEGTTDEQLMQRVEGIVKEAINSYSTGHYDAYQWFTNYIYN